MTRGGRRPGAGRPRGTGTGRTVKPVMFHLTPETIALIDEHRAPRLSRSQLVELALIAFANQPILSGPPDDDDRWPDALDYNGARYASTGKVGTRNGLPVAEYERDGERVWLDKADTVYPE